ncbi:MAG: SHOCT domain-containing protein [Miltoncostaeaceae bacterium]
MTDDPQPDIRAAVRALGDEFSRAFRQAETMVRAACDDLGSFAGDARRPHAGGTPPTPTQESPVDTLRQLAALHAEGVITTAEFDAKKAQILERI